MKKLTRYLALAAIAVTLGSCSFAIGALNHKKARVVASAIWHGKGTATRTARSRSAVASAFPLVRKTRALPPRPASAVVRSSRSAAPGAARDISASTDIDFISYTITNLDLGSGEAPIQDFIDPNYPYIDVFLTPGQNYRISVDVTLLASSPALLAGQAVGITSYGDAAIVAVPADGSDVYVDMTIHAQGIVIENQVFGSAITYKNPSGLKATSAGVTREPQDKFFYTSDSLLYYFNYTLNSVSQWSDIGSNLALDTTNFGGTNAPPGFQIYAVCPDPANGAGFFYAVGFDGVAWQLYSVNYDPAGGVQPAFWSLVADITLDVEFQGAQPTASVTGVAADLYADVYVTYYNEISPGAGHPMSGVLEYYFGSLYAQYSPDTSGGWSSTNSIFTDVLFNGATLYALASPNTNVVGLGPDHNKGTADVYMFDYYMNQLSANPTAISQPFTALTGNSLSLPNKFVGMPQGGSFFISQTDFAVQGPGEALSVVSLDLSSVSSVP
jgi:hypothetical protein